MICDAGAAASVSRCTVYRTLAFASAGCGTMRTEPRSAIKLKLRASPALISPERSVDACGGTFSALQMGHTAGTHNRKVTVHSSQARCRAANPLNSFTKRCTFMELILIPGIVLLVIPRVQLP